MRNFLILLILITGGFTLTIYQVEQKVKETKKQITTLSEEIKKDSEHIRVLRAEYAYLSQPKRIEEIARVNLKMDSLTDEDIKKIRNIPKRKAYYANAKGDLTNI